VLLDLGVGVGGAQAQRLGRGLGAQAVAVPDFALFVFGLAKQGCSTVRLDDQRGTGLGKASEVVKVAVVPVQKVAVAVARPLGGGGDDGDAVFAQLGGNQGAALGVEGLGGGVVHATKSLGN
jgi:hypothetical protein